MERRVFVFLLTLASMASPYAQEKALRTPWAAQRQADYVVGPQDVLIITSYDQAELSGKFTVQADGTFAFPLTGRLRAGGLTLRQVEEELKNLLIGEGYFRNPQITVVIEEYKSQKIFVVGEVRRPGAYPLSGDMRLVEALALAGSTLPTASGEAVIVRLTDQAMLVEPTTKTLPAGIPLSRDNTPDADGPNVDRVNLRDLENGVFSQNVALRSGDTVFVLRAPDVYVFGQVRNPGAYPMPQKDTSVLQALALAGGVTDRGSTTRIQIVRIVNGERQEIKSDVTDPVQAGDTIVVRERFF